MDFARFNPRKLAEHTVTMQLTDPDTGEVLLHEGKPIEFDFYGLDGQTGRSAAARLARLMFRRQKKEKAVDVGDLDEEGILKRGEANEAETAQFYAELCTDMRNVAYLPDDKLDDPEAVPGILPFSQDNVAMFFRTRPWFMPQVDDFLGNRLRWRKPSAKKR